MPPVNLYDSLLERMEGHPYSHYFSTWCPFDSHSSPALLVFSDGLAKCLSCNKVWTHAQVERKIGHHFIPQNNTVSSSRVLPAWRKWETKYGDIEGIVYYANKTLKKFSQFQRYFKERKIFEFVEEGNLGYLDSWVLFPVMDDESTIVDIVVRSIQRHSDIRYVVRPNGNNSHPLYVPSWKRVNEAETVYVVFGMIDAISLHLVGLPSVTGTSGKSLSPELLKPLNKRFIIIPDENEEAEAHKLANSLGWRGRVKQISYSKFENTKDCDDIRRIYGDATLIGALL